MVIKDAAWEALRKNLYRRPEEVWVRLPLGADKSVIITTLASDIAGKTKAIKDLQGTLERDLGDVPVRTAGRQGVNITSSKSLKLPAEGPSEDSKSYMVYDERRLLKRVRNEQLLRNETDSGFDFVIPADPEWRREYGVVKPETVYRPRGKSHLYRAHDGSSLVPKIDQDGVLASPVDERDAA